MKSKDFTYNQEYTTAMLQAKEILSKIGIQERNIKLLKEKEYKKFQSKINKSKTLHQAEKADLCGYLQTYLNQITL